MKHSNCTPDCGICANIDYSRRRHAHADNVTCVEAGIAGHPETPTSRAFSNPCLYCGTDDNDVPYEDTDEHRNTSQHQYAQLTS